MATLEAPVRPRTSLHSGPFVTEPFFDFRKEENARRNARRDREGRSELGREYDLMIGGKRDKTTDKIKSLNPPKPSRNCRHAPEGRRGTRRASDERCIKPL